ncbi:adenylyl-sulfate kinase [Notoacmeibacter ruber]|uniref:Gluconokinase n=2 Tax=Notoacmeibacter ruber TaxID=2670375 RepID=A0A3L7JLG1_9HYPH|nr:adenylyl-sulfate kinase [Notoacmeibacter ruber]
MGVSGAGKSTLAVMLADRLDVPFIEADDYHSDEARDLMSRGIGLNDEHRTPWLDRVGAAARESADAADGIVIACSALRRIYRDRLRRYLPATKFVFLNGAPDLIAERLKGRQNHFVGQSLLESQLNVLEPLEPDEPGVTLDLSETLDALVDEALRKLGVAPNAAPATPTEVRIPR